MMMIMADFAGCEQEAKALEEEAGSTQAMIGEYGTEVPRNSGSSLCSFLGFFGKT